MSDELPGVSVREAAIRLGTSESDVRRRIKRGDLAAESIPRPGGTLLRVLLPDEDAPAPAAAPQARQDAPDAVETLALTVETLAAQNAALAAAVADLSLRAGRAEGERDLLREEVARLRARRWWKWW